MVAPTQTGLLLEAVMLGAELAVTVILVVAVALQPGVSITVTVYVPPDAATAGNPAGSLHCLKNHLALPKRRRHKAGCHLKGVELN